LLCDIFATTLIASIGMYLAMEQLGIYEKLMTQLIEQRLDKDIFFVGERKLEVAEASV